MLNAKREPILVIGNGSPKAIVRRDETNRSITFYKLDPMTLEDIEKLFGSNQDEDK